MERNFQDEQFDNEVERKHFFTILASFKFYRKFCMQRVKKTESYLNTLPELHQKMLKNYREHLKRVEDCIVANDKIIQNMIKDVAYIFDNVTTSTSMECDGYQKPTHQDMEKVQCTLKQFARDWSNEGAEERKQCYQPIIDEIVRCFPEDKFLLGQVNILVPGAGLGRLAYELASRGFSCQGNEFSLFMLFASNFVLNKCSTAEQYTLYPWASQFVNNKKGSDQTRAVLFPDVSPSVKAPPANFSMAAGDFIQVYTKHNYWNAVATCFFIDCANNVIQFIETIYNILLPGGVWVNLGPLLYHYSDMPCEQSIEPSVEDLLSIIKEVGFIIEKSHTDVCTKYAQNPNSMLQSEYKSIFLVCYKPDIQEDISDQTDKVDQQNHPDH